MARGMGSLRWGLLGGGPLGFPFEDYASPPNLILSGENPGTHGGLGLLTPCSLRFTHRAPGGYSPLVCFPGGGVFSGEKPGALVAPTLCVIWAPYWGRLGIDAPGFFGGFPPHPMGVVI